MPVDVQPSLWLASAPSEEVEVAVVGGGIVGLSTAYWLGKAGKRAVVLEAGGLACRASGRNAGFLMTGTPLPYVQLARSLGEAAARCLWETSRENRELLRRELLDPGRVDCDFRPEGSWIAALAGTAQEDDLEASAERLSALGFDLEWRRAEEVRRASGSDRLGGAIFQARDGGLQPVRLCRGMARVSGAEVRTGFAVRALEPAGERVRLVAEAGELVAERVVVATNAYSGALLPQLAGEIRPVRGQMLATAPGARDLDGVWYINEGYEYVRQLGDGTVVLGGGRAAACEAEVGTAETPTATVQGSLERFLAEAFPRFAGRPIRQRWAGIMGFTDDGLPRIGEVPELPGVLYAAGFNGHGMSLGFATGRYLARRVMGETVEPLFPGA
jgi:glycine/D-amino acid oxidase-like deaminating enzyme